MVWVAGVDGCKRGKWIGALMRFGDPMSLIIRVVDSLAEIVDSPERPQVVTIDMPMGLPDKVGRFGRPPEQMVRKIIGARLQAAVFSTSCRDVVYAPDYTTAIALSRRAETQPFAPSPVANAIMPRIRQVDALLRQRPELIDKVFEVHPELIFCLLNNQPLTNSKHEADGLVYRRKLLIDAGVPEEVAWGKPPQHAAVDDVLDALAAMVAASEIQAGRGKPFGEDGDKDRFDIPIAIWGFEPVKVSLENTAMTDRPVPRAMIEAAAQRIVGHARVTPVMRLGTGAFGSEADISLKLECLQHAGSFKTRGAFNNLLSLPVPAAGVSAASGGNHGAAVAYAARQRGVKATIFVPEISPAAKIEAIRRFGADVRIGGAQYDDAQAACDAFVADTDALKIHPFAAKETIAGQGTLGREWDGQEPDLDTVLVAVGGGGLISGIAAWFAGSNVKVVGVEPSGSRALQAALEAKGPVEVTVKSVAADSLGARNVGPLVHEVCKDAVDHVALVDDEWITKAQGVLWRDFRLAVEPGGAAALGALLSGAYTPRAGERLGVLVCGANVDLGTLGAIVG